MRMITDTMYFGNYKFDLELDTGSETGANQLTVWVAEKLNIDTVPLKQFGVAQLLNALIEPERTRLHDRLEEEKRACQRSFEQELAGLQGPSTVAGEKQGQKIPEKVKRKVRKIREQKKAALQRLEVEFGRRELWPLDRRWFDPDSLQAQSRVYSEEYFLRDFYFEEANFPHIRNFCRKFALDEAYRKPVLAGETRWAKRNALFVRNLLAQIGEDALLSNERDYDCRAREFFRWVDAHVEEIQALPEYQRLVEKDSTFQPSAGELDPLIRQAVEALNRIPGVTTQFSCQGVSGKVRFGGRELLVVSPHEEYAYVSFSELRWPANDAISALLPLFPSITNARIPYNFVLRSLLRSTGDNLRFRTELVELAERVLASMDGDGSIHTGESGLPVQADAAQAVESRGDLASGGISPSRLEWLCQPAQIERTLHLLFSLNHWAKAREQLLYADRQGLYQVKAAVVQQAVAAELIRPVAYIDGSAAYAGDYSFDLAADMATEVFLDRLAMLFEEDKHLPAHADEIDSTALSLFARITGHDLASRADIETLDVERIKAFLLERLEELVAQARSTRQPIAVSNLAAFCIEPVDLLDIHWSRNRPSPRWDELDESEAIQLDPEGLSLIAFEYDSSTAHYVFHLPFRVAERFLPEQLVRELRTLPRDSRECGVFFGRTITEAESQEHPVEEILHELGVDIAAVCPHELKDKREHVSQLASRYSYWEDDEEDDDEEEDWGDEDWEVLPPRPRKHKHAGERAPGTCPLCGRAVEPDSTLRVEHWRHNHPDQDLMVSSAAWVLGKSKTELKSPTAAIPPDYRGPSSEQGENGARFWRLETLEASVRQSQECASES
ncbi:MAG TPA: hypothetical protein VF844_21845 [Ktedonobacteraceae bacterium]